MKTRTHRCHILMGHSKEALLSDSPQIIVECVCVCVCRKWMYIRLYLRYKTRRLQKSLEKKKMHLEENENIRQKIDTEKCTSRHLMTAGLAIIKIIMADPRRMGIKGCLTFSID